MKFKKKPVAIEAEQYLLGRPLPPGVWIDMGQAYVTTIHGQKTLVALGDWIIAEPNGIHYYPCKPDIFEDRYEAVTE